MLKGDKPIDSMIVNYAVSGMTSVQFAEAARVQPPARQILLATGYTDLPTPR